MAELIACQCRRGTPACKRLATQEDLRCDVCRGGCTQLGWGPVGTAPEELEMTSHWEMPTVTWGVEPELVIMDDPIPPPGLHLRDFRGLFPGGPVSVSAPPATHGHAGAPPNPPSTRTSPHMSGTDHTRNPRNEEA